MDEKIIEKVKVRTIFMISLLSTSLAPLYMLMYSLEHMDNPTHNQGYLMLLLLMVTAIVCLVTAVVMVPEVIHIRNLIGALEVVFIYLFVSTMYSLSVYNIGSAYLY